MRCLAPLSALALLAGCAATAPAEPDEPLTPVEVFVEALRAEGYAVDAGPRPFGGGVGTEYAVSPPYDPNLSRTFYLYEFETAEAAEDAFPDVERAFATSGQAPGVRRARSRPGADDYAGSARLYLRGPLVLVSGPGPVTADLLAFLDR